MNPTLRRSIWALSALVLGSLSVAAQQPAPAVRPKTTAQAARTKGLSPQQVQRLVKMLADNKTSGQVIVAPSTPAKLAHLQMLEQIKQQQAAVEAKRAAILSRVPATTGTAAQLDTTRIKSAPDAQMAPRQVGQTASAGSTSTVENSPVGRDRNQITLQDAQKTGLVVAACTTPRIESVNGGRGSQVVFTTDPNNNTYVIEGCAFGDQAGQLALSGPFNMAPDFGRTTVTVGMSAQYWSDKLIVAHMDPNFAGAPDLAGGVTLTLTPATGPPAAATGGLNFYAARESKILTIELIGFRNCFETTGRQQFCTPPATYDGCGSSAEFANLQSISDIQGGYVETKICGPPLPTDFPGRSAEVIRTAWGRFGAARDSYSFESLNPGFYVDSYRFEHSDIKSCSDMYIDGLWNAWWDSGSNTLNVTTQEVHCHDYFMFGLNNSDYSASVYAVTFWATGPKGVIP